MKNAWGSDCKTQLDPDMPTMHINDATVEVMNSAKLWEYYEDNFDQTSFVTGCNIYTNSNISRLDHLKKKYVERICVCLDESYVLI